MSMVLAPPKELTPDDVLAMSGERLYELVDGRLVEKSMSYESNDVAGEVVYLLRHHCRASSIAYVTPEQGYTCFPSKPRQLRVPDVSLILAARMTAELYKEGFTSIRPDLIVEVVSPNDRVYDLREKLDDYRDAEIPLVWLLYPPTKTVEIIRADGTRSELGSGDELTGEAVLPGFRCRVAELFGGLPETKVDPS